MKKRTYKNGDRVRIIGNGNEHDWRAGVKHSFEIGEVCTVLHVSFDDGEFRVLLLVNDKDHVQYVSMQHVEPYKAKKAFFKRLFEKFSQKH